MSRLRLNRGKSAHRHNAVTVIEMLVVIVVCAITIAAFQAVSTRFGSVIGSAAGALALCVSIALIAACYREAGRRHKSFAAMYPDIYRVVKKPDDMRVLIIATGAEVQKGDYGWEAEPLDKNGLVYLHGLSETWDVIWYAAFRDDEIEFHGPKPRSQYLVPHRWGGHVDVASPCPFVVQSLVQTQFGRPYRIINRWVQGVHLPRKISEPG